MKTLLLIDGSNFLYRAYHASSATNLTTRDGKPTGATRFFINMLHTLMKAVPSEYIAVLFDPKGKTFRSEIYPRYKESRPPMPDDLRTQCTDVFEAVKLLGLPLLQIPGFEADDTAGSLARMAQEQGMQVVIATGDKDYCQLVNEHVRLINTKDKTNSWLDSDGVFEKFAVRPDQIIDFLALKGDAVDDVPGIPKCGDKTAAKWLSQYQNLDGIIANADAIGGVVGKNLRENLHFLPIAKQLVTIKTDMDLSAVVPDMSALIPKPIDYQALYNFYKQLQFASLMRDIEPKLAAQKAQTQASDDLFGFEESAQASVDESFASEISHETISSEVSVPFNLNALNFQVVLTPSEAQAAFNEINVATKAGQSAAISVVYNGTEQQSLELAALSVGFADSKQYVFTIVSEGQDNRGLTLEEFKAACAGWLADATVAKHVYDAKRTAHVLANMGLTIDGVKEDVLLQDYVIESHMPHALEKIALNHLEAEIPNEEEILGKGVRKKTFAMLDTATLAQYAATRSYVIAHLQKILRDKLNQSQELTYIYDSIEMPVSKVLFRMEQNGVLIDALKLYKQTLELNDQVHVLESKAYDIAGEEFKLSSPKQLGEILFEKMGALFEGKKPKKTASGNYSTNEEVLTDLALNYPLAKIALEYRAITKLVSTYTDKLGKLACPKDGRIHTTFEQAVAVTGRLSSTDPNLQNIPVRTAEGRRVREAFVASKGCKIISADYSQIELRIMAHLSGDKAFTEAFRQNQDIHKATAAEVFNEPLDQVTSDQRRIAKVINFGLIYGMSAFGLAKNLGIERVAAKNYIERYFERYPGVKNYMETTRQSAIENGYVKTVFGRLLSLPDIKTSGIRRAAAERAAINAPMQGTAADLIKLAMIEVQAWLDREQLRSKLILQVHDELILEVPENEVELVQKRLPEIMDSVAKLHVPLLAEVGVGDSWEAAH